MAKVSLYNRDTREIAVIDAVGTRLSRMRHRVRSWASLILSLSEYSLILVTLTYRDADGWQPNDIRDFLDAWTKRYSVIAYAWVVELQRRGAPHYHIIFVVPPGFSFDAYPDSSGLWDKGYTNVMRVRSPYYLIKYLSHGKDYQKDFANLPKGMRTFAVVVKKRYLSLFQYRSYWLFRLSVLPAYFQELFAALASVLEDDDLRAAGWWRRPPGGGIFWDGHRFRSPWVFLGVS